ncbi:hypothetical protein BDE36_2957 [Arcticibacter tournemirensis]|uniref:Uncharacterized protein n=1 Tax=Arcticibacter tournemirensis TaxID=699437 RepID=A0A5M9GWI3_9SPHI|nr:hypothetical protein [Arcticibacter tournemirensis]KAA8477168.1 hypothetical protein F1649_19210 [Arcticibacter tournemirensis]TQM51185.1 hypothetical protein BDE36_2957 [Arcticibacter tournemirensis]
MVNKQENPYRLFDQEILQFWKDDGVKYIKLVELQTNLRTRFFELIPDSEIPDSDETIYSIDSDDITELLEDGGNIKFLVHEIYLGEA